MNENCIYLWQAILINLLKGYI